MEKVNGKKAAERSDAAANLLTIDRITVDKQLSARFGEWVKGRSGEKCPRRGYSVLHRRNARPLLIETRCKQKRCVPCSPAVRAHVALKAEIGSLIRPVSYFITVTNRMGIRSQKDAGSVQGDWRRFLYLLKRRYPELTAKMEWMKVIELTKKGQAHLHLIMSGLPGGLVGRCGGNKNAKSWVENGCFQASGTCVLHAVAKSWLATTGDSWVCDASKVRSALGAGQYVAKYVTKAYDDTRMEKLGFKRSWSASHGFAPDLRVRLRGTIEGKWTKVEYWKTATDQDKWLERSDGNRDLERVGHPLVMEKYESRRKAKEVKEIERLLNGFTSNIETIDKQVSNGEHRQGDRVRTFAYWK